MGEDLKTEPRGENPNFYGALGIQRGHRGPRLASLAKRLVALGYPKWFLTIDGTTNFLAALGAADAWLLHLARMGLPRNHVSDDRGGLISSARQQVPVDASYVGPERGWANQSTRGAVD